MDTKTAVVEALERAPGVIVPLVREVPPALLKRRPAPRKWSAHGSSRRRATRPLSRRCYSPPPGPDV